jgi:hypothetical protein
MTRRWRSFCAVALLIASCRAEATVRLDIEEDGSGRYSAEVGFDEELRQGLAQFGADVEGLLSSFDFGIPGSAASERVEGDMTFSVVTASFADANELTTIIESSLAENPFETFTVEVDEEGARIDAVVELPPAVRQSVADNADLIGNLDVSATVVVDLPGTVSEANATSSGPDGELIWDLPLTAERIEIHAVTTYGGTSFPWALLVVAVVAGALLVLWLVWDRRQRHAPAEAIRQASGED